jgi:hypothetical protein
LLKVYAHNCHQCVVHMLLLVDGYLTGLWSSKQVVNALMGDRHACIVAVHAANHCSCDCEQIKVNNTRRTAKPSHQSEPCISTTLLLPAAWCSLSMFCVMSTNCWPCSAALRSYAASATCPGLGLQTWR